MNLEQRLVSGMAVAGMSSVVRGHFDINNSDVSQQLGQRVSEEVSHFYHPTPLPARNANGFWQCIEQL